MQFHEAVLEMEKVWTWIPLARRLPDDSVSYNESVQGPPILRITAFVDEGEEVELTILPTLGEHGRALTASLWGRDDARRHYVPAEMLELRHAYSYPATIYPVE
jgi:hypothetical protein